MIILIENNYSDGHESQQVELVDEFCGDNYDSELDAYLQQFTGDGHSKDSDALYQVTILDADDRKLVGRTFEWVL
jgi:hypothetical protein